MNLKSPLRRTTAVAVGALIGLAGVAALATPASAHHPDIIGGTSCVNEDGTWEVTWTVANSETDLAGKITGVAATPADSTIYGIEVESALPIRGQGVLTGVQKLKASDTEANIKIDAEWLRDGRTVTSSRTAENAVTKSDEKCQPTTNPSSSPPAPEPSTSTPTEPEPSPSTPPSPSQPPAPSPSVSVPPAPSEEPDFVYEETCETITVGIAVPSDWPEDIKVVFTTSEGDSKTVVGKIGEVTTVDFPAVDGLKITATPEGYEDEAATITYEAPAECDTAGGGGSDDPTLPLTGAAAGSIAGGAAVLLAVGAGLFFMARRRKVKFTA